MAGRPVTLGPLEEPVRTAARELMGRATAAGHPPLSEPQREAFESDDPEVVRVATFDGPVVGNRMDGYAQAVPTAPDHHYALEVVAEPGTEDPARRKADLAVAVAEAVAERGGGLVRLWVPYGSAADDRWAAEAGFVHDRELLQLRCPLPLPPDGRPPLETRPFRPGHDEEAWLRANNRAFAGHPEQGGWDVAVLRQREAEPWFDPAGFLVREEDGVVAGWCWTKVHRDAVPAMGEIYVIGVDPDFQGRGWGRALTRAGLDWLASTGLTVGMLYVDAANGAAVDLYRSLGFRLDHADRAYHREVAPGDSA